MKMTNNEIELLAQASAIAKQSETSTHAPTPKKIFLAALKLIEDPKNWCQGSYHEQRRYMVAEYPPINYDYFNFDETNTQATVEIKYKEIVEHKYCSLGAIKQASSGRIPFGPFNWDKNEQRVLKALEKVMGMPTHRYNDTVSHSMVVNAWRLAGKFQGWL
jgi:hypothetical protein